MDALKSDPLLLKPDPTSEVYPVLIKRLFTLVRISDSVPEDGMSKECFKNDSCSYIEKKEAETSYNPSIIFMTYMS